MTAEISHPQKHCFLKDELFSIFVNASLNYSRRNFSVIVEIFRFLKLIIENSEITKMNSYNIATIFAPLLLPSVNSSINDVSQIIAENENQINTMKFILDVICNQKDNFVQKYKLISKTATQSGKLNNDVVIRGDTIIEFFRNDICVCAYFNDLLYVIDIKAYDDLFSKSSNILKDTCSIQLRAAGTKTLKNRVKKRLSTRSSRYVKST